MDWNVLASESDPLLLPTWIAAIAAAIAVPVSATALIRSWRATRHANRSATAAEGSREEAKRSADAADRSVEIADKAKDAAVRSASAAEEQVELAKATAVEWEPVSESSSRIEFVNVGTESAHNVEVTGSAIIDGPICEPLRRKNESVKFVFTRRSSRERRVTITWNRPPEKGGEPQEWSYDLWPPNQPKPQVHVSR